jgi:hypothetical protein
MKIPQPLPIDENSPPPVIESDRVIFYAIVEKDVTYTGLQKLYVGDKLLGKAPRIAICKSMRKGLDDYIILYCSKTWKVLGVGGQKTLSAAKKQVERYYSGISKKWIRLNTSEKTAKQWLKERYPKNVCSFCRQIRFDASAFFPAPTALICSSCVEEFAAELKRRGTSHSP